VPILLIATPRGQLRAPRLRRRRVEYNTKVTTIATLAAAKTEAMSDEPRFGHALCNTALQLAWLLRVDR